VSSAFFETLGVEPLQGRSLASARNQQAAVLSFSLWSRSFGSDPRVIGRSITLDGLQSRGSRCHAARFSIS
jgi:putative ABC transport system permease protein